MAAIDAPVWFVGFALAWAIPALLAKCELVRLDRFTFVRDDGEGVAQRRCEEPKATRRPSPDIATGMDPVTVGRLERFAFVRDDSGAVVRWAAG